LKRLRLVPQRANPNVPFFVGSEDHRHGFDDGVRCGCQKAIGAPVALNSVRITYDK
jgi:hypothetical protein